jgi:hypothetical protein
MGVEEFGSWVVMDWVWFEMKDCIYWLREVIFGSIDGEGCYYELVDLCLAWCFEI